MGIVGGLMQIKGFNEARESFLNTSSMLEVRAAMKATKWGRRYIYFLWTGNIVLVILALSLTNNPALSVLVGYFSLMFAREIITLKSTFELYKLSKGVQDTA
jgi:hypothetical protein